MINFNKHNNIEAKQLLKRAMTTLNKLYEICKKNLFLQPKFY